MGMMFGFMDSVFPIMFFLVFGLVFCTFTVTFVRGIGQWNKNNHSPKLTVPATVVGRREHRSRSGSREHRHYTTSYYITFQFESGDRLELHIPSNQFGYIVEGDRGSLTFQGTRFLGFERT